MPRLGEHEGSLPERCIHIGDRESDIYELYCLTLELGGHFLVRACVDRLAGDGGHTIATEMEETSVKDLHYIDVRDDEGEMTKPRWRSSSSGSRSCLRSESKTAIPPST
ncbi:hypothetical protein [Bradyrhizobium sp. 166]|uniref:hypothetical protein n=1 Tax=Bradyrhizobium sp. 166 TaxID=2782638 RepID=UPI001FF9095B|nr:hypothetical protein [Bradyrhizobium sp. 166]